MKTVLVGSLSALALLIIVPLAFAQENQPQAGAYCPNITQDLKRGDCDEGIVSWSCKRHVPNQQVTELQKFLASYYENYPDDYITGKFLSKTQQFVQTFQREQNLPAFGYVGPLTRAAIARVCGTDTPPPPPPPPPWCVPEPAQTQILSCPAGQTGSITQMRYSTCPGPIWGSWITTAITCAAAGNNGTFSVTPLSGTAPLAVTATFQNGTSCTPFTLTWGDGTNDNYGGPPTGTSCTQQTVTITKTHTYTQAGTYIPTFKMGEAAAQSQTVTAISSVSPPTVSLTINGQQSVTVPPGQTFTVAWNSSNATSCNLTNAQGQTNSTPPNVSGSSQGAAPAAGTTFTYTLSCTNSGGTTTKSASVMGATSVATNVGACVYKGTTYQEDHTLTTDGTKKYTVQCDNSAWVTATSTLGFNICDKAVTTPYGAPTPDQELLDLSCVPYNAPERIGLSVVKRHGKSPLTVTAAVSYPTRAQCNEVLSWGDGASESPSACSAGGVIPYGPFTHTYSNPRTYVVSVVSEYAYQYMAPNSANVRVDPSGITMNSTGQVAAGTVAANNSSPNQSQLASALAALESALKAILKLLGQ